MPATKYPCSSCQSTTSSTHALQCIVCDLWCHKKCGISEDYYQACENLKKEDKPPIFVCVPCRAFAQKVNQRLKVVEAWITKMERTIETKNAENEKLKKTVADLETNLGNIEKKNKDKDDAETTKSSDNVKGLLQELSEQEARKGNIVCQNIPESTSNFSETRMQYDVDQVHGVGEVLDINTYDCIKTTKRLGKREGEGPRPLLVIFKKENVKNMFLSRSRNLLDMNDPWCHFNIYPDLTANQRNHDREVKFEIEKLNEERTEEECLNFFYRSVGRKGLKKPIKVPVNQVHQGGGGRAGVGAGAPPLPTLNRWTDIVANRNQVGKEREKGNGRGEGEVGGNRWERDNRGGRVGTEGREPREGQENRGGRENREGWENRGGRDSWRGRNINTGRDINRGRDNGGGMETWGVRESRGGRGENWRRSLTNQESRSFTAMCEAY